MIKRVEGQTFGIKAHFDAVPKKILRDAYNAGMIGHDEISSLKKVTSNKNKDYSIILIDQKLKNGDVYRNVCLRSAKYKGENNAFSLFKVKAFANNLGNLVVDHKKIAEFLINDLNPKVLKQASKKIDNKQKEMVALQTAQAKIAAKEERLAAREAIQKAEIAAIKQAQEAKIAAREATQEAKLAASIAKQEAATARAEMRQFNAAVKAIENGTIAKRERQQEAKVNAAIAKAENRMKAKDAEKEENFEKLLTHKSDIKFVSNPEKSPNPLLSGVKGILDWVKNFGKKPEPVVTEGRTIILGVNA